tara:strand:- start:333 stop:632 length:300 start_codon:yes stop_codon:yes gene_type:complete
MSMTQDILNLKDKLLNPKRGDDYNVWLYQDGWRLCNVVVGNKRGKIKPVAHGKAKPYNRKELEKELGSTYWYAAKCHASRDASDLGLRRRKKGWEKEYA